jgi:hypothetical protein
VIRILAAFMKRSLAILILSLVLSATTGVPTLVDLCCGPRTVQTEPSEMDDCSGHDCCDTEVTVDTIDDFSTAAVTLKVVHTIIAILTDKVDLAVTRVVDAYIDLTDHPPHSPPDRQALLSVFLI